MKRIALETSAALLNRAGTGRVTTELSRALRAGPFPEMSWLEVSPDGPAKMLATSGRRKLFAFYWEWLYVPYLLPRRLEWLRPDIFHCLFPLPLNSLFRRSGCAIVTTFLDVLPLSHEHWFPGLMGTRLRRWMRRAATYSDAFLALSDYTRQAMSRHLGIAAGRVHVTYPGHGLPGASSWTAPEPFILTVGTLEPRKNLVMVFKAYARLKREGTPLPRLYVVGMPGWGRVDLVRLVDAHGLAADVRLLGFVPDERLQALYRQARMLVYPSLAEGFGLPPLEAMAAGCPVVVADTAALPEVVGQAGLMVDPTNETAVAAAVARVLADGALARRLAARGRARAAEFSWERCARETVASYRRLLGSP